MRLWQSVVGGLGAGLVALAAGCSGGGGGDGGGSDPDVGAKDLFVVDMDLDQRDGVSLNTPLSIEFSEFVMPETVRHDTVQIRLGPRFGIQSFGDFKIDGNVVTFFPQLPSDPDLSDAGFQPQSSYRVTVAGHPKINRVKSFSGRPLVRTYVGEFKTAALTSADLFTVNTYKDPPPPAILFTNPPDVLPTAPWTTPGGATGVNTDAEIQMVFNRVPLLPSTITTNNVSLTLIERLGAPQNRPIQGTPIVEQTFDGTSLRFVPTFPLADQARYVLRVENRVTDLTGAYDVLDNANRTALRTMAESGVDPALTQFALAHPEEVDPRTFLIFTTRDEAPKNLTIFVNFDGTDLDQDGGNGVDTKQTTASFNDAVPGAVAGVLTAAGGTGGLGVFNPSANTTLSTNSPNAINGAFNYSEVTIPANVTVVVTGTLPGQILSLKPVDISGRLGASGGTGGDGENGSYSTTGLAPLATGGPGGPGGGKGGDSSTSSSFTNPGGDGQQAPNGGGFGGQGGKQIQGTAYTFGGGGGGGGHQYAGNSGLAGSYPSGSAWNGAGGAGGAASGIQPTSVATNDGKTFHTKGVGGGGGGAGGNFNYASQNWHNGASAGGGGGGAILIKSAGAISVTGDIVSKGGNGGNSNFSASNYLHGGSGGGGAGGSIVLYANSNLDVSTAVLDTSGGAGGATYPSPAYAGRGGTGGGGYIQLEDADSVITGLATATILPDYYVGRFDPTGTAADAPSFYVSTWFNSGVFDPILQPANNLDFTEQNFVGCSIKYEMQMAREDPQNFGNADAGSISAVDGTSSDLTRASNWVLLKDSASGVQDVTGTLNFKGYQFYRLRISFTLKDGQKRTDPVPFVDRLRFRIVY